MTDSTHTDKTSNWRGTTRTILFLWLGATALIGLYQGTTSPHWGEASILEWTAAQFPDFVGIMAAIVLIPLYVLTLLEYPLRLLALEPPALALTSFYVIAGVSYLYWLAGALTSLILSRRSSIGSAS